MIQHLPVLLLPGAFASLVWLTLRTGVAPNLRVALSRGLILWGLFAVLLVEGLGAFGAISRLTLGSAWLLVILVGMAAARSYGSVPIPLSRLRPASPQSRTGWVSAGLLAVILALTALVAWLTPPQTWDSLNYHLPRMAHWAQQGSVEHFATGIEVQNSRPPGGEYLLLHVYLLAGGGRLLTLVGWGAFAFAIYLAGATAAELKAGDSGRWLAALFAATVPMAIIQASGTANDILVALFVLAVAGETLRLGESGKVSTADLGFLAGAAGLALVVKPTAFPYLVPFALWLALRALRSLEWRRLLVGGLLGLALIGALNFPYLARNYRTYGAVLQQDQVEIHSNQLRTPAGVFSNLLKNAGLHASTPVPALNKGVFLAVLQIHDWMGLDPNDPRTTAHRPFRIHSFSTHEERSGNPLHAALILNLVAWLLVHRERVPREIGLYVLGAASTFLLFSSLFQWQVFGSRYHLPFFLLWAPVAGWVLEHWRRWARLALVLTMVFASLPWLISIRSRPLVPIPGEVSAPSVLTGDRETLMFTNGEALQRPYAEMASLIRNQSCQRVGLALSGSGAEYPLWSLLGAPDPSLRIEWLVAGTPSAHYLSPSFEPCAVICDGCKGHEVYNGLPLAYRRTGLRLFLQGE